MPSEAPSHIHCHLDDLLTDRGMTLTELSRRVGVSLVNLSVYAQERPCEGHPVFDPDGNP